MDTLMTFLENENTLLHVFYMVEMISLASVVALTKLQFNGSLEDLINLVLL